MLFLKNNFDQKNQISKIKYIQNKHEAYGREHHQRSVVLAVEPQSELDLSEKIAYTFWFFFLSWNLSFN